MVFRDEAALKVEEVHQDQRVLEHLGCSLEEKQQQVDQERQELDKLRKKRVELDDARECKLDLIALLDENIQEFGERLTEIRRSTQIQLAWNNTTET